MEKMTKMRKNQIKAGYNSSGSQRCKCKEYGKYYTINPKRHAYPEEIRERAIKMYYSGVSGRGVGRILKMNKSNAVNWIKKAIRRENEEKTTQSVKVKTAEMVFGVQAPNRNSRKRLYHNDGAPESSSDSGAYRQSRQINAWWKKCFLPNQVLAMYLEIL